MTSIPLAGTSPMQRAAVLAVLLGGGLAIAGCPSRTTPASLPSAVLPCDSTTGGLAAGATLAGREGRYELVMRATSGAHAGGMTRGTLVLVRSTRAGSGTTTYPLEGTLDARMSDVGATIPGTTVVRDASRPGVLVLEYPRSSGPAGSRSIIIRLGSEANAATLAGDRFDGAFTALQPRRVSDDGFAGRWDSGVEAEKSGGYFCARRLAGE